MRRVSDWRCDGGRHDDERGVQRSSRSSADAASQEHHGGGAARADSFGGVRRFPSRSPVNGETRGPRRRRRAASDAAGVHGARRVATREVLTAQERQVARLAREGLSSPDIGARLFRSPRTVEWHLRNAFIKLGIHSRRELTDVLSSSGSELVTA